MVSLTNKSPRQTNISLFYDDRELWLYGPYKLVPFSKNGVPRVALPGRTSVTVPELRRMAAERGWPLRAPTVSR